MDYQQNFRMFLCLILTITQRINCEHDDYLPENIETVHVEDNVYVLDDTNYDSFVKQHSVSLVEFYAPWCGHCQSLAPEYSKAAKMLQDDVHPVVLAKIDGTKYSDLAHDMGIGGYPTLFVYRNGERLEYDGPRTAQGIVDYMREKADPNYKPPEESVITLTDENFDETISKESLILVEFYAPWCGHCKRLKPEYERAARRLLQLETQIKLAKIDATVEKKLAERFAVKGYPTLILFRNGKQYQYKGPREENGIVSYMKEIQKLPSKLVVSKTQLRKELQPDIPTIIGFFDEDFEKSPFYELFIEVAYDQFDENNKFLHVFNQLLTDELEFEKNDLVLYLPLWYRSKYEPQFFKLKLIDSLNVSDIVHFLNEHSIPLVGYRNPKTNLLYANKFPLVVVYYDVDFSFEFRKQTQLIREQVLKVASLFKKEDITFVIAKEQDSEHDLKLLKLEDSGEDVNVGFFMSASERYAMEPTDSFDSETLTEFVQNVRSGQVPRVIKSSFAPDKNPIDNVWTVVGDTFDKLVTQSKKDILLEFYAPWCGHCKSLEPVYLELGKLFATESDHLSIMKLDATSNDYPSQFKVDGFPTIYYITSDDQLNPVPYSGDRTLDDLSKFVRDNLDKKSNLKVEF